jgi:hypothetical protein
MTIWKDWALWAGRFPTADRPIAEAILGLTSGWAAKVSKCFLNIGTPNHTFHARFRIEANHHNVVENCICPDPSVEAPAFFQTQVWILGAINGQTLNVECLASLGEGIVSIEHGYKKIVRLCFWRWMICRANGGHFVRSCVERQFAFTCELHTQAHAFPGFERLSHGGDAVMHLVH